MLAASLLGMDLYVARHSAELWRPLLGVTLAVLALAGCWPFFSRDPFPAAFLKSALTPNACWIRPVFEQPLPSGDDDLGMLARSLQRTAPRIRELVESLKLEGARREAILSSMVEGVLAVDKDLRVTFCNHSFARTVDARLPVVPGIPLLELVRDPGLREIMTTVISSGERVERRWTLPGAGARSFEVLAGPLGASTTRGALAILHDVTQLERLERIRRDFVANVSHELRTPLAAIRGYAETLLDGALEDSENNRRFVEIILAQATRLTNIASDLLMLSELESSALTAPPQPVSIRAAHGGGSAHRGIHRAGARRATAVRKAGRSESGGL